LLDQQYQNKREREREREGDGEKGGGTLAPKSEYPYE